MIDMEGMAVTMPEVEGHPNRAGFRGVLTVVDVPSERAPSGSSGRRVVLTRAAAEAALPSLLGMALDYAPTFDRHDVRRKVGVITSAEIVGRNLEIGGYVYARDFPELMEEIGKSGRRASGKETKTKMPIVSQRMRRGWGSHIKARAELVNAVGRLREMTAGIVGRKLSSLRAAAAVDASAMAELGMSYEITDVVLLDKRARVWTLLKVTFTGAAILRRSKAAYQETWIELA
jgi:hypothetical protein